MRFDSDRIPLSLRCITIFSHNPNRLRIKHAWVENRSHNLSTQWNFLRVPNFAFSSSILSQALTFAMRSTKNRPTAPVSRQIAPTTLPMITMTGPSLFQRDQSLTPPNGWVTTSARTIKKGTGQYFRREQNPAVIEASMNHKSRRTTP